MDEITQRLAKCFQVVFPDLPAGQIQSASQASLESWDSIATVTLANVVEEEFSIPIDFDRLADLNSFATVRDWVVAEKAVAEKQAS